MSQILRVFLNADLRAGHDGLTTLAKDQKLDVKAIEPGSYIIFLNRRRTILKLYCSGNVIAHLKLPQGQHIDLKTIQYIPRCFNGKAIKYDEALEKALKS